MKRMTVRELAEDVATLMGERLLLECQPEESPFPDLEDQVRLLVPGLLATLILEAPAETLFDGARQLGGDFSIDGEGVVSMECPEDFLRPVCIKMSDWRGSVTELTPATDRRARMQASRWEGIRGNRERPVAIRDRDSLKLYSSGEGARLEAGYYMARPRVEEGGVIAIPDTLYPLLLQRLKASLVVGE